MYSDDPWPYGSYGNGTKAVITTIYLAGGCRGMSKIREEIEEAYYSLDFTFDGVCATYRFNET